MTKTNVTDINSASQAASKAPVPDWDAIKDKRIGQLNPEQYADAGERWLRDNAGWFRDREYIEFLLHRLDQARGLSPQGKPWLLGDDHQKTLETNDDNLFDDTDDIEGPGL
jgi:hypothetical protein